MFLVTKVHDKGQTSLDLLIYWVRQPKTQLAVGIGTKLKVGWLLGRMGWDSYSKAQYEHRASVVPSIYCTIRRHLDSDLLIFTPHI